MDKKSDIISISVINGLTIILNFYLILGVPHLFEFVSNSFDGPFVYILYMVSVAISIPLFLKEIPLLKWIEVLCLISVIIFGLLISGRSMIAIWGVAYSGVPILAVDYLIPVLIGVLSILNIVFLMKMLNLRRTTETEDAS